MRPSTIVSCRGGIFTYLATTLRSYTPTELHAYTHSQTKECP